MSVYHDLLDDVKLPRVALFRQELNNQTLENIEGTLLAKLQALDVKIWPGMRVAITGGSRGIDGYAILMKTIVGFLKSRGACPFIVPAMGSHGGGIAEKQTELLAHLGISEETMGVPVISSMEVVELGLTDKGLPAYIDKNAYEADGIVLLNRIKCHTGFRGDYESGLVKMMAIGLAKHKGAELTHRLLMKNMAENIVSVGKIVSAKTNILFGVGSVENGCGKIADVAVLTKSEIWTEEPKYLRLANQMMPSIPIKELEAGIIKYFGKEISGTGVDTNVIGRYSYRFMTGGPDIANLGLLNLTESSNGNAIGMGFADYITSKVRDVIRFDDIYANGLTTLASRASMMPITLESDRMVCQICIKAGGKLEPEQNRMVIIRDTKHLEEMYLSEAAAKSVYADAKVEQISDYAEIPFDGKGNILLFE